LPTSFVCQAEHASPPSSTPALGGRRDLDSDHRYITVAARRYGLASRERDTGLEPATFSLGKRKRPFLAVTGSDKQLKPQAEA
jgi:hypothetical protein